MTLRTFLEKERAAWRQGDVRGPLRTSYFVLRVLSAIVFFVAFGLLLYASWGKL